MAAFYQKLFVSFSENWTLYLFYEFSFLEDDLYLYKTTIRPCIECSCYVWAGASSLYLGMLDKLQKLVCRTDGPTFSASLELLAHPQNIASLYLFLLCYFDRCSSELAELVSLLIPKVGPLVVLIGGLIFLSSFLDLIRMSMSKVSFLAEQDWTILCLQKAFL